MESLSSGNLHISIINPKRSSNRSVSFFLTVFYGFPTTFVRLQVSCLPACLAVARYIFDKPTINAALPLHKTNSDFMTVLG